MIRVAIVAMRDPRLQERACACIVAAEGAPTPTLESVQKYLEGKGIAKQYWPEQVVVLDDFPSTASGKIQKFQLRKLVDPGLEDEPGTGPEEE